MKNKLLIITPHLSTGGLPQYLYKKLQVLNGLNYDYELYLIEYSMLSTEYVAQRNKIFNMCSMFTLDDDKKKILELIDKIRPDIIHLEEIPELFMDESIADEIYNDNRNYFIVESSHTVRYNPGLKQYLPDRFALSSEYQIKQYGQLGIPLNLVEYPIGRPQTWEQDYPKEFIRDKKNVIIVGLFTKEKNQGYVFELASRMLNDKVVFHFIGNQAENFKHYWQPIMTMKPENCLVHGEKENLEPYYKHADLLIFPSFSRFRAAENNPLVLKEATSWKLPFMLFYLETYLGRYDKNPFAHYLSGDVVKDAKKVHELVFYDPSHIDGVNHIEYQLKWVYDHLTKNKKSKRLPDIKEEIFINFIDGVNVILKGVERGNDYTIKLGNGIENTKINSHTHFSCKWANDDDTIEIHRNNEELYKHLYNPTGKRVYVALDSRALGDTIAWLPAVFEYQRKWDCELYLSTYWNQLFVGTIFYDHINFIEPGTPMDDLYAMYNIGVNIDDKFRNKNDYRTIPLQQVAYDYLGLEYKELRPEVVWNPRIGDMIKSDAKYVIIGPESTAKMKLWNRDCGWQEVVDYLNDNGYDVGVVTKNEPSGLKNVTDFVGKDILDVAGWIKYSQFFIGLPSGLSWLAWALRKPVIMISGISHEWFEFKCNRIHTKKDVCKNCFTNPNIPFDKSKWDYCPIEKNIKKDREIWEQFECSKSITVKQVIEEIKKVEKNLK